MEPLDGVYRHPALRGRSGCSLQQKEKGFFPMERKIRVLLSKVGLDGHDRGIKVLARLLREAGFEVIYLGMYHTPEEVIEAAIQEDVDVIGVSFLCGEHLTFTPRISTIMKERRLDNVLFLVGGVIPMEDLPSLKAAGANEVFVSGVASSEIIRYIKRQIPWCFSHAR